MMVVSIFLIADEDIYSDDDLKVKYRKWLKELCNSSPEEKRFDKITG